MKALKKLRLTLKDLITLPPHKAAVFFKTGEGQYAQGDQFIGITVPNLRKVAKNFMDLSVEDVEVLLHSKINEERFLALIILVENYNNADEYDKEKLYQFYLKNLQYVNNWNLVDASAHLIIGAHLWDKDRQYLLELAQSEVLWDRRISVVSTWYFIRKQDVKWTFKIASLLQKDKHDLIHKAVGWMLREAGKRDEQALIKFLDKYANTMPRTMLRYAIEKFTLDQRKNYLSKSSVK